MVFCLCFFVCFVCFACYFDLKNNNQTDLDRIVSQFAQGSSSAKFPDFIRASKINNDDFESLSTPSQSVIDEVCFVVFVFVLLFVLCLCLFCCLFCCLCCDFVCFVVCVVIVFVLLFML